MNLASRICKLEAALAAMALGVAEGYVVARGPSDANDADLEAQWASQLEALGLSLETAQRMGVVLVHRIQFCSPHQPKEHVDAS